VQIGGWIEKGDPNQCQLHGVSGASQLGDAAAIQLLVSQGGPCSELAPHPVPAQGAED